MNNPIIISVGGGKGGVGKSTITANIGTSLCKRGFTVGYIDADLGGANLHLCLGIPRPGTGLQDFVQGRYRDLSQIAVPLHDTRSWLISGASDILELANPNFAQKQKLIRNLSKMSADYILVDLGAGSDYHVTDFYAAYPHGIIVTDGLPTSIENAYGFLKNGILRGLTRLFPGEILLQNSIKKFINPKNGKPFATMGELFDGLKDEYPAAVDRMRTWLQQRRTFLILNMIKDADDVKVGVRFTEMVKKYLYINIYYIGYIVYSADIRKSIKAMRPLVEYNPGSKSAECYASVTQNLIALTRG